MPGHRPAARPERLTAKHQGRSGSKKKPEPVDLSTFGCPLHYVKARHELRGHADGDVVEFVFQSVDAAEKALASLLKDGHEVLAQNEARATVRKRG
jgi:TusA-related sulfurtransferase